MENKNVQQNKNIKQKIMKFIKSISKNLLLAFLAIVLATAGILSAFANYDGLPSKERALLKLEEEKKEIEKEICLKTKETANYKMSKHYDLDDEFTLTEEEIDRIEPKTIMDCEAGL